MFLKNFFKKHDKRGEEKKEKEKSYPEYWVGLKKQKEWEAAAAKAKKSS